ncbi:MAG: efflux RND transporter periplasmic adaptor subunit [Alphaproteobacteria bacterium]
MIPGPQFPDRRRVIGVVLIVLALGAGTGLLAPRLLAPSRAEDADNADRAASPKPPRVAMKNGLAVVTLSAAEQQASGIETARAAPAPAQDAVVGYGAVLDSAPLSELSNRYLAAESEVATATAKLAVSRGAFERAKILYKDRQNISAAQLEAAEGTFEVDRAMLDAAQSRLRGVAESARQAWGGVVGVALIERTVLITRLVEREDYLVRVTLPAGAAGATPPETASVRLDGGRELSLAYLSPAPTIDPRLQGIGYLYRANADSALLPGMNLEVLLAVPASGQRVVVPEAAVVWLQGKAWIYLRTGPNTFVRRDIVPDRAAPDGGYLVSGLPPNPDIVVRGAQMLLSEEFRAQVPIED